MKDTTDVERVDVAMCIARDEDTGEPTYLILRKASVYQNQRGQYAENPWEVPGGKIELNKQDYTSEDTAEEALRELREETGLSGDVIDADPANTFTVDIDGVTHRFYPCLINVSPEEINLSKGEHDDYTWVSSDEFKDVMTGNEIRGLQHATN